MPYINTVDINGTTYYFENLTDGNYVVDLPELKENGTFLLQGDVEDKLNSYQSNKPLSANQGRVLNEQDQQLCSRIDDLTKSIDSKDKELDGKITDLSKSSSQKDTGLDEKISTLRTDMGNNDASTLNSAKAYADEQSSAAISSANEYANTGLDKKLDKSGGKITGALEVVGALTADQKLQTKYGMTIYKRGDVSKEITAVCTGENAGKFIGKSETDLARISVATPVNNDDAATKKYVDDRVGSVGGAGIDYFDVYAEVKYSYVEIMDGFYVSNCLVTATFDEIKEALDAGKTPRIIETNSLDSHSLVSGIMSLYSYDSDYFVFTGVSRSANSASGLAVITIQADGTVMYRVAAGELPAVKDTDNGKYMLVDGGAWKAKVPPTATQSTPGLMSSKDKTKLDGIEPGANKTIVDEMLSDGSTNPVQNKAITAALASVVRETIYPIAVTATSTEWVVDHGIAYKEATADRTFDDIKAAHIGNKTLVCEFEGMTYSLILDSSTAFIFASYRGAVGDDSQYAGLGKYPTSLISITTTGVVISRTAGDLPVVGVTDNGKMLIVSGGEWALQRVPGATVDAELSTTSENPVQNKTVTDALNGKLPKTGGTVTGALRTNDSFSAGGTIAFGEAPIVLSQTADGAAEIHSGTADVDDNPPPLSRLKVARPTEDDDAATKKYVDDRAVRYDAAQGLTPDQKLVACSNIGAVNEKRAWVEGEVVLLPRGADGVYTINITPSENSNDYTLALDAGPENVPVYVAGIETPTDAQTDCAANVEYVKNKVSDATILTSPNGTKYKITVSDDGKLSAVAVN